MTQRTQNKALNRTLIAVAVASGLLVAARMIWPKILFDSLSLTLFGIAAGCLVLIHLPFKKLKFGDFEAELDAAVDILEKKVVASESAEPAGKRLAKGATPLLRPTADTWQVFFDEYLAIVNATTSNVERIIAVAILLEKVLAITAVALYPDAPPNLRNPRSIVDRLARDTLIVPEEQQAFREFWDIRNRVVHEGIHLSAEQTARIIDLAGRLIRSFA